MLTSVRPIGVRRFPSRSAASWSCTGCGTWSRIDRSWTVEVEAARARRFSIVLCEACVVRVGIDPTSAGLGPNDDSGRAA